MSDFFARIRESYTFSGDTLFLGALEHQGSVFSETPIAVPLSTMNRHGLISGATGTGKTKTIQKMLEGLSRAGIPTVMMDMKGDVSGMAMPGEESEKIRSRADTVGETDWKPQGFPVEFFSLLGERGSQMRVTVSEFGPTLFTRLFELSDAQGGALAIAFQYADSKGLPLLDLVDLRTLLTYLASDEGKAEIAMEYGSIAPGTLQVLVRKILELEAQGGKMFFGERSLDVADFLGNTDDPEGQINILRLMDSIRSPLVFSTFILSVLTEVYQTFPEVGDLPKPKLVFVIDEAHVIFRDMPKPFLAELEMMIKLIRSKGVSILFCTQNPADIPDAILGQLGLKVQHALRAFTAKDQEAIRKAVKNFPLTEDYDVNTEILALGIGEALVTAIGESGRPTPLVRVKIGPPRSRMDTLTSTELESFLSTSSLYSKYHQTIDSESAHEILSRKIEEFRARQVALQAEKERKKNPSITDTIAKSATKSIGTELGRTLGKTLGGKTGGSVGASIARSILGSIFK